MTGLLAEKPGFCPDVLGLIVVVFLLGNPGADRA
jgi:hypothetical protein